MLLRCRDVSAGPAPDDNACMASRPKVLPLSLHRRRSNCHSGWTGALHICSATHSVNVKNTLASWRIARSRAACYSAPLTRRYCRVERKHVEMQRNMQRPPYYFEHPAALHTHTTARFRCHELHARPQGTRWCEEGHTARQH